MTVHSLCGAIAIINLGEQLGQCPGCPLLILHECYRRQFPAPPQLTFISHLWQVRCGVYCHGSAATIVSANTFVNPFRCALTQPHKHIVLPRNLAKQLVSQAVSLTRHGFANRSCFTRVQHARRRHGDCTTLDLQQAHVALCDHNLFQPTRLSQPHIGTKTYIYVL